MSFTPPMVGSPDYHIALHKLRKLRTLAGLVLLLVLLGQITVFFLAHYDVIDVSQAAEAMTYRATELSGPDQLLHYLLGATTSLGVLLAVILLIAVMAEALLITADRRLGVAAAVSALAWAVVLLVLVFPAQLFFSDAALDRSIFALPGVLYTFGELRNFGLTPDNWGELSTYLNWLRFVVAPLIAVLVLLFVLIKSGRGFKLALGEIGVEDAVSSEPSDTVA